MMTSIRCYYWFAMDSPGHQVVAKVAIKSPSLWHGNSMDLLTNTDVQYDMASTSVVTTFTWSIYAALPLSHPYSGSIALTFSLIVGFLFSFFHRIIYSMQLWSMQAHDHYFAFYLMTQLTKYLRSIPCYYPTAVFFMSDFFSEHMMPR